MNVSFAGSDPRIAQPNFETSGQKEVDVEGDKDGRSRARPGRRSERIAEEGEAATKEEEEEEEAEEKLLRRGSMFVFSRLQFEQLVSWPDVSSKWRGSKRKLLDLGAGDGVVTSIISPLFHEVFVTEVSPTMKWLLAGKGFRILDVEEWARQSVKFNVITCLNLLDRCDRPCDILEDMKKVLSPDGFVVLAMVLPYRPYVEIGSNGHSPSQLLDIEGCSFEKQVSTVIGKVLEPAGYEILRWTRLPYLCEGDIRQSYYWLDDVVFFMKPRVSS
ncbi:hypothetical protein RUM44_004888 [Polyplax serrata]|uniref:Methyltransferase-like protein 9 n=1 Tax=Polyplax serrata TaxID=468196 RepID=A0ABR1B457_POLSC